VLQVSGSGILKFLRWAVMRVRFWNFKIPEVSCVAGKVFWNFKIPGMSCAAGEVF